MILMLVEWLLWLFVGGVAGGVAHLLRRRSPAYVADRYEVWGDLTIGVLGAFIGGLLADQIKTVRVTPFDLGSVVTALIVAVILLLAVYFANRRRVRVVAQDRTIAAAESSDVVEKRTAGPYLRFDQLRIHIALPLILIALIPLLDALLLGLRLPDLSARPAPYGEVRAYESTQGRLEYLVYAPADISVSAPLVVLLHGCMQDPYTLESGAGMRALADANGFVLVFPQQNFISSPHRCWNWYDKDNQQSDSGEAALIAGVVAQVQAQYPIDASRIYVAGLSSGGAMTSILASCYPDVFAAAAVHSGMAYESANSIVQAVITPVRGNQTPTDVAGQDAHACAGAASRVRPVLVVQGTAGMIVFPVNGGHTVEQFAQTNDLADDGADNDSFTAQMTDSQSGQVEGGHTYSIQTYDDGGLLQSLIVDGMGHMWSGGTGLLPNADPRAPNASEIIWNFFEGRRLE